MLSPLFRGKFLHHLQILHREGKLQFPGKIQELASPRAFRELLDPLYTKNWVVYGKPSFGGPAKVLEYLSRYTHRVAISNDRLLRLEGDQVWFLHSANPRSKCRSLCGPWRKTPDEELP